MFGYVRPFVPELKIAEYEKYRAVYCGLCREIGHTSGQLARLGLSYDIVLLCSVRMVLEGVVPEFELLRCAAHPAKKRLVMRPNTATAFTAAAFAALSAAKNDDDLVDEHGIYRIKPLLLSPLMDHLRKTAAKGLPDGAQEKISALLCELDRLEKAKCPSADETSDAFGAVLGYVFSLGLDEEKSALAGSFGSSVGKFIYMCDAADDLADDKKHGRYNPLLYGWNELALEGGRVSPIVRESVTASCPLALEPLGEAVKKLDPSHPLTPIIENIVYLGLPLSLRRVFMDKKSRKMADGTYTSTSNHQNQTKEQS